MAGVPNLASRLGAATPAYGLVSFALGALILPGVAPAAILAAYALGMAGSLAERLPTRLPAWVEMLVVTVLLFLLVPPVPAAWALALMGALQAADRYLEGRREIAPSPGSPPSSSWRRGPTERESPVRNPAAAVLALGLVLLATGLAPALTGAALAAATALELLFKRRGGRDVRV